MLYIHFLFASTCEEEIVVTSNFRQTLLCQVSTVSCNLRLIQTFLLEFYNTKPQLTCVCMCVRVAACPSNQIVTEIKWEKM